MAVNEAGDLQSRFHFMPFGDPGAVQEGDALHHRFAGGVVLEETGLYALGPRLYDPEVGRFLQPDPLVADPGDPQALNRYSYAYNNPLSWIDPSGLQPSCPECGGGGGGGIYMPPIHLPSRIGPTAGDYAARDAAIRSHNQPAPIAGGAGAPSHAGNVPRTGEALGGIGQQYGTTPPRQESVSDAATDVPGEDNQYEILHRAIAVLASSVLIDAGVEILAGVPEGISGLARIGVLATTSGASGAALLTGAGLVIGTGLVTVGVENLIFQASGRTPISDFLGFRLPIFMPAPPVSALGSPRSGGRER